MNARLLADALCGIGEKVHALLRNVQQRVDINHYPRHDAIERQLAGVLHDFDRLIDLTSKPVVGADGVALCAERGKVRYGARLIEFTSPQARSRFIEQVLEALRLAQLQVFAAERVSA